MEKLTTESVENIQPGDYIRLDYGEGVSVEGTVRKIDPKQGVIIDRPNGQARVHGPSIFKMALPFTRPKEHPVMLQDSHTGKFKVV